MFWPRNPQDVAESFTDQSPALNERRFVMGGDVDPVPEITQHLARDTVIAHRLLPWRHFGGCQLLEPRQLSDNCNCGMLIS